MPAYIKQRQNVKPNPSAGFTIVELLIATLVFSTILIVITVGVLKFTSAYYKGVNASTTQNTARNISDKITQAVQFGSADITPSDVPSGNDLSVFCAGGYVFAYTLAVQYDGVTDPINNAGVYMMPMSTAACDVPSSLTGGEQLLGNHMRVTNLSLSDKGSGLYAISVTIAYGDGDLLCTPGDTTTIDCNGSSNEANAKSKLPGVSNVACKLQAGSQFCAVSTLNVSVEKRVGSST